MQPDSAPDCHTSPAQWGREESDREFDQPGTAPLAPPRSPTPQKGRNDHAPDPIETQLVRALAIATEAHADQTDKLGAPYMEHIRRVVDRVAVLAPTEISVECQVAAALHDAVEDTPVTLEGLRSEGFSQEVVDAVDSVTKRTGEDYFDMVRRAASNPIGRWVKLADNLDNADPERAADLPPEVRARLADKYAQARRILAEHGAADTRDTR